jgi:hypothetical protein
MKVNIEIEDSDISELLWDRIESYGTELTDEEFNKIFEKHKEELRDILQSAIEDTVDSRAGGDEFESFIEEHGLAEND